MGDNDELIRDFLIESTENLDRLDQDFVALEQDTSATDRLAGIFRTIHTIKGTCGFLGFGKLESVAHVGENLLSKLRDGRLAVTSAIVTSLLQMVDAVREILANIEATGQEGDKDYSPVVETLTRLNGTDAVAADAHVDAHAEPVAPAMPAAIEPQQDVPAPAVVATEAKAATVVESDDEDAAPAKDATKAGTNVAASTAAGGAIRVDVNLLDKLMNLVGELVLARNQILQFSTSHEEIALAGPTQRLNHITTELQEGVMKTRMQPIGTIWSKLPRVVRDLSQMCGKRVRIEMEGTETELDKTIIEAIKDPLTHVIRNSVDHGIESPEKRKAAGKPEEGVLQLRAFHEGGQVNIEIIDDGHGIDVERVKRKAIEKGLITADQAQRMSDREASFLIFLPGFSTAEKITNVSGRGVGMDVVKTNIEKIGGTVDVQTRPGNGTTLRIKIPLTLAIIPALTITSATERFAIPQVSLLELVRLEPDQVKSGVEMIHGAPVYRLRGNLLPLVYLHKELNTNCTAVAGESACNIVVLQADGVQFGLVVDEINDTEEIVVKPLGKQLKGMSCFAGATIMGDGKVALILDVMGIAQKAGVVARQRETATRDGDGSSDHAADTSGQQTVLLFVVAPARLMAVPLSTVARLEEFQRSALESAGDYDVVQYRGRIMPLIHLSTVVAERRHRSKRVASVVAVPVETDTIQVVVQTDPNDADRTIGLVVERIADIVCESFTIQPVAGRPGVLGSAVIQGKVTEVIDIAGIVKAAETIDVVEEPALAA